MKSLDSAIEEAYVPWEVGAQHLNVKRGMFFFFVRDGLIGVKPGSGPRNRLYALKDILVLKEERARGRTRRLPRKRPASVLLDWLKPGDIPACLALDQRVFGEDVPLDSIARYQERQKKNPRIAMAAFTPDRKTCLGYIGLIPLPETLCLQIMNGRSELAIPLEEVEVYDHPGGYALLATGAAIDDELARPDLLILILLAIMDFWTEQWPERWITRVYAQTVSDTGEYLVQHFFMMPMFGYPDNAYMLDFGRPSASKIVRNFIERLKQKDNSFPPTALKRFTPPCQPD